MIVFAKGAPFALERLCDSNYQVIGLDWLHDPTEAYKVARNAGKVVQGNADPGILYGSRESTTAVVESMVRGFGGGKQGWIANLGHGMTSSTLYSKMNITDCHFLGITPLATPEALEFYLKEIKRLTSA